MGREWDGQSTPRHSGHRRCIVDQCKPYFGPQRAIVSTTIQTNGIDDSFPEQKARPRRWVRAPVFRTDFNRILLGEVGVWKQSGMAEVACQQSLTPLKIG